MVIDHVTILNNSSIGGKISQKINRKYTLKVNFNSLLSDNWVRKFRNEWVKNPTGRNVKLNFSDDDFTIEVSENDNIQQYIELTKKLVESVQS